MNALRLNLADQLLLSRITIYSLAFVGLSLLVLLLERMIRIFDVTMNATGTLGYVAQMLINLIPHYLGIALPASFFMAVLLTIHGLSENGELTALQNAGVGLPRILGSIMGLAIVLTVIVSTIVALVQPHSRYTYRKLVHVVANQSLDASVREGAFTTLGDITFLAERRQHAGDRLNKVFVYSRKADGRSVVTTAPRGALTHSDESGSSVLSLESGVQTRFSKEGPASGSLRFDTFQWRLDASRDGFRARGIDVREMTFVELWSASRAPPSGISHSKIAAELNSRLVRAATILILPFLAIPFGLSGGRAGQSSGIVVGLAILVLYQKAVEFGSSFGGIGSIPPWMGVWVPFLVLGTFSLFLFCRVAYNVTEPPLATLSRSLEDMAARFRRT